MLLETTKSYLFVASRAQRPLPCIICLWSGTAWTSCGPLPARNGWEGECIPFRVWHPCFVCRIW
jgi:hypothetical protein